MSGDGIFILIVLAIPVLLRLMAGSRDHDRVSRYVRSTGGRLISTHWRPFGRGWFGEKGDRIYEVRYVDANGDEHVTQCKTSMWSGVYFTEDRIMRKARTSTAEDALRLAQENRRLREELERLKKGEA